MDATLQHTSNVRVLARLTSAFLFIFVMVFAVSAQDLKQDPDGAKQKLDVETAQAFAQALNMQDVDSIANFIDFGALAKRVSTKLDTDKSIKDALITQYKTTGFARTLTNSSFILPPGTIATFAYKRVIDTEEFGEVPMLRIDYESGGHEFMLVIVNEANLVEDLFYASKGSLVSTSIAGATQLLLPAQNGFIARLMSSYKQEDTDEIVDKFQKMIALRQQAKFGEVYKIMQTLPEELMSEREIINFDILVSQSVSDEAYVNALSRLDKYFGDQESTAFMLIDFHVSIGNYEDAMTSADIAAKFWGRDAAIAHLQANIAFMLKDNARAIALSQESIEIEPSFEAPYWTLVHLQEETEDFVGINKTLALMQAQFDETFTPARVGEFFQLPKYSASDEYKAALDRNRFLP